jgi:hypothetical protein
MSGIMDAMIDDLMELLDWINDNVRTESFNHSSIEKRFCETLAGWKDFGMDIAEFCLMLVVQICVLAGITVKGHKDLHNLVIPVATLGVAKQLEHVSPHEHPMILRWILSKFGMEDYGTDAAEGMLCKTSKECMQKIFNAVMKGQYLFMLCTTMGKPLVKPYGSRE